MAQRFEDDFGGRIAEKLMNVDVDVYKRQAYKVNLVPVVTAGTRELLAREAEAHRLHKVQPRARAGARPRDVARVLRNLRLYEDDVQRLAHSPSACLAISSSNSSVSENHSSSAAAKRCLILACSATASDEASSLM